MRATGATHGAAQRELDAAGIKDPQTRAAYLSCRVLNARHGKSYYLATVLLPAAKRPAVHALYGFARWVDDLIDEPSLPIREQAKVLDDIEALLRAGLPATDDLALPLIALRDTVQRWQIPMSHFISFIDSMRMDLDVTEYQTRADLDRYMWGSAAVIGLQMLPILQPIVDVDIALPYAADLGIAFQLTNFIRDVGEDLRRGRIYLPQESLRYHGVDRAQLARGVVDGHVRQLLAGEIACTREIYRSAAAGIRLLHPTSQPCIRTAFALYSAILDEVERNGYQVLDQRATVANRRRLAIAAPGLASAMLSRRRHPAR